MATGQAHNYPRPYNAAAAHLPNGGTPGGPVPGAAPLLPNQGRIVQAGSARVLCIADVRGNLQSLNQLAAEARANYIVHTGDFGFYDDASINRIAEKTLKHVAQYSPLLPDHIKRQIVQAPPQPSIKERFERERLPLSELPLFLNKTYKLNVPVYTVWGACEDVQVLEKLRSGEYKIDNLHIIDEAHSRLLEIGGVKLRLLGLGGAVVMHKLFDNGEGRTTIAGGQGTMWTTLLQMGELIDTANRVYDPAETRVFVTHASPAREGLLNQLSVALKADFSISAGLHFRYGSSYNEFSVNPTLDHYRGKLAASKTSFNDVWETVKSEVEPAVADSESQSMLLQYALELVNRMPSTANGGNPFGGQNGAPGAGQVDEGAFKNMWNFNLADAAYGWLVLDIDQGRIGTEMRAQGFNFAHRGMKMGGPPQPQGMPAAPPNAVASPATQMPPQPAPVPNRSPAAPQVPAPQQPQQPQQLQQPPQARMPPVAAPTPPVQAPQAKPQPTRTGPSPAPANASALIKPATPQPAATNAHAADKTPAPATAEKSIPSEVKPNGTTAAGGGGGNNDAKTTDTSTTPKSSDAPMPPPPQREENKKPSQALFINGVKSEEEARNLLPEADRPKIERIEQIKHFYIAHFASPEEMQAVYARVPNEHKQQSGDQRKPTVQIYRQHGGPYRQYGAGNWGGSARGGAQSGGGYRSGGASDSEGGRGGRGGFRGGRGRGEGRGEGRGGRGRGRGGMGRGGEGSANASPAPTPAAATGGGEW